MTPTFIVSAPVIKNNIFLGLVVGTVDLSQLSYYLKKTVGNPGDILVADSQKRFVIHPNIKQILTTASEDKEMTNAIEGTSGQRKGYGASGALMFRSFRPVPKLGWGFVIEQSTPEALHSFSIVGYMVIFIMLISSVGSIFLNISMKDAKRVNAPEMER